MSRFRVDKHIQCPCMNRFRVGKHIQYPGITNTCTYPFRDPCAGQIPVQHWSWPSRTCALKHACHRRRTADRFENWQRRLRHQPRSRLAKCMHDFPGFWIVDGATLNPACRKVGSRPGRAFVRVGCTKALSFNDPRGASKELAFLLPLPKILFTP